MWHGAKAKLQQIISDLKPLPQWLLIGHSQVGGRGGGIEPSYTRHLVCSSASGGRHCLIVGIQCAFRPGPDRNGAGSSTSKGRSSYPIQMG